MIKPNHILALIYDFDGTLSPLPMQEYSIFPALNINADKFWEQVNTEARQTASEPMLVYMRHLMEIIQSQKKSITPGQFAEMGKKINYFPGVEDWFKRQNEFVKKESKGQIALHHYIISAGLKEILTGISIKKHFKQIYASEYYYNENGMPTFPKLLITDTTKTQFLFRINKGKEHVAENINEHMPESIRPVPFENMIYIGDGLTDVPCMTLTRKNGGHSIAVYKSSSTHALETCNKLLLAGRVNFIAEADYRENSKLDTYLKTILTIRIRELELK